MNNDISVRSLLVENATGKFIKAIDERSLSDFLPLLAKDQKECSKVQVFDFTPVIQYFHNELEHKLKQREHQELTIKRGTVFNIWMRLKTITNDNLLCQLSSQLMQSSEEVLNWIHTRLPDLKRSIGTAKDEPHSHKNAKTEALHRFSDDVEVFFEVLLCNIDTTAKIDINSLKSDFILTEHCNSIRGIILALLQSEAQYSGGGFSWHSVIHNICMEDLGINPEALVYLIDPDQNLQDIRSAIFNNTSWKSEWVDNHEYRSYTINVLKADKNEIERIKILSKLLENINSIILLLEKFKGSDIYFNDNGEEQAVIDSEIKRLLINRDITSKSR